MEVIQEVGSYAGFAAVVGLAVLSALYFSQARDVRRLREWAGRAPERAAEQAAAHAARPDQAAQQASRPPPTGAVRPIPAAKPAAPAAAGAAAGTAVQATEEKHAAGEDQGKPGEEKPTTPGAAPVPATAAANAGQRAPAVAEAGAGAPEGKAPEGAPQAGRPAPTTPAAAPGSTTPPTKQGDRPDGAATPPAPPGVQPARPDSPARTPGRPGPVGRSPAAARSQSTAVLPASGPGRSRRPGEAGRRRLDARYIALIVAGVIVIGGAAAFGISQLGGEEEPQTAGREEPAERQAPINPSTVTVSVLNGTTVPGLAAQIGDEVESAGFQRGNVANALDQQRTTSVVLHSEGADREARLVARRLGVSDVEPIDPDSQALAGNASVVVIVGADQTQ